MIYNKLIEQYRSNWRKVNALIKEQHELRAQIMGMTKYLKTPDYTIYNVKECTVSEHTRNGYQAMRLKSNTSNNKKWAQRIAKGKHYVTS